MLLPVKPRANVEYAASTMVAMPCCLPLTRIARHWFRAGQRNILRRSIDVRVELILRASQRALHPSAPISLSASTPVPHHPSLSLRHHCTMHSGQPSTLRAMTETVVCCCQAVFACVCGNGGIRQVPLMTRIQFRCACASLIIQCVGNQNRIEICEQLQ